MEKMKAVLYYPGGFELRDKELELTHTELMAMLMSNKVFSEEKCFIIESKEFHDTKDGDVKVRLVLGDCY